MVRVKKFNENNDPYNEEIWDDYSMDDLKIGDKVILAPFDKDMIVKTDYKHHIMEDTYNQVINKTLIVCGISEYYDDFWNENIIMYELERCGFSTYRKNLWDKKDLHHFIEVLNKKTTLL